MRASKPFGNLQTAKVFVIGHDPRLNKSMAEAEYAFFFEYLKKYDERPAFRPEAEKYGLAKAVWDYLNTLANQQLPLETLYVTNLCNEFLPPPHGRGTILIPDDAAQRGVEAICSAIAQTKTSVIVPMSMQTFYHLCRLRFIDEDDERIMTYIKAAQPEPSKAEQGKYAYKGNAPFLKVCGQRFHHRGIPVVPILHVKMWPIKPRFVRYVEPMQNAKRKISEIMLSS